MKNLKKSSLLTGTLVAGALFATSTDVLANTSLDFNFLGTGSQLRSRLLTGGHQGNFSFSTNELKTIEGACGEKKAETKTDTKAEAKTKDAKCGEGKCGEGKCGATKTTAKDKKSTKKTDKKTTEAKSKEASCGEKKTN